MLEGEGRDVGGSIRQDGGAGSAILFRNGGSGAANDAAFAQRPENADEAIFSSMKSKVSACLTLMNRLVAIGFKRRVDVGARGTACLASNETLDVGPLSNEMPATSSTSPRWVKTGKTGFLNL